ncbi:MAG: acyl-CoA dehydrogenase family protein, partial [Myxococcota bacterium]|nr:acyl-CoA dehydrogenase family protein [Myxococcota bacterium]
MDLRYSDADEAFRKELRAWLAEAVPAHGAPPPAHDWEARRAWDTSWQRKLFDAGYAGINWPAAYGGREASL